ncbi:uncharacterized protein THITE_2107138 [Thermothielavioides terrestris NRRL 8126]|jgi:hypothetical protein|uniref:Uncharacterized protein n=1 Tax=Thermothielavioides terrestris (strain ATCC 38088 / NRRL 8126) TaxID=578455 RepID=G2QSW0_THETT|nr:uncharacterized protein THITE_2107138 [Thermothielavioides terrestris NRRL 8126]AEO62685.1 hypothetical protein THITE_2107138 [Thermothielavioides terrestris NRRL 8126]
MYVLLGEVFRSMGLSLTKKMCAMTILAVPLLLLPPLWYPDRSAPSKVRFQVCTNCRNNRSRDSSRIKIAGSKGSS